MLKVYYRALFVFISVLLSMDSAYSAVSCATQPFFIVAITWNIGDNTAEDSVVEDMVKEISANEFPDVVLVGTQEEMAKSTQQLYVKLLEELNKGETKYKIAAKDYHTTLAGFGSSVTKSLKMAMLQNRTSLTVLVKDGYTLADVKTRIDYPPGKLKANNSFIVVEGNLKKTVSPQCTLPISVASVHLSSRSDKIRRQHANAFFKKNFKSPKNYTELLEEAKRFNLVMGDFNERAYLMRDNSVSDRGYLTNFMAYGYDFSQRQMRPTFVYGTYGFTKLYDNAAIVQPVESLKDTRGRAHNAKGGFLDRIVFSSGLVVDGSPAQYGALTDFNKFEKEAKKNKVYYATSDHLPVIRFFTIKNTSDEQLVKNYILRRLPNFFPDSRKLQNVKPPRSDSFRFYDDLEPVEEFQKRLSTVTGNDINVALIKKGLENLQKQTDALKAKLSSKQGQDPFFTDSYQKIMKCNIERNSALENMDDQKASTIWYVPASLSAGNLECYNTALSELVK